MSKWQDIETAPMDGTDFLAWRPDFQGRVKYHFLVCRFNAAGFIQPTPGAESATARTVTHWMPLPEPPLAKQEEQAR